MAIQKWSERIWVAKLAGDPEFIEDMETLGQAAESEEFVPDMVLDLSEVNHLNSSNISQMLMLRKRIVQHDAKLILAGPPDHVWAMLISAGMDKVFHFSSDTMTALAELQMEG